MLSSESIKTLEALYEEIAKMKENLSYKEISLDEKAIKIASLKTVNSTIEEKNSELNKELNNSMKMLEDLKVKNKTLISQVATLKGQYEPSIDFHSLKELQNRISQHEKKHEELQTDIDEYKQTIMDQQKIIDACDCDEKSMKIELLVTENSTLETKIEELNEMLKTCKQISDDTKIQNDNLSVQLETLQEQFEKSEFETDRMDADEDLLSKLMELESENRRLEIAVDTYKNQIIDQQFIIDEYDCQGNMSPNEAGARLEQENQENTEHENMSLRKLNLELQSQLAQFKEDATRLKLNNEKCKDELFSKKVELESMISENTQYKKDSLLVHASCNEKISTLEYQLDGLREINVQLSNKFNQLKEKYDKVKHKQKQDYKEMLRLTDEFSEEQQVKIREDDIIKINGMKSECAKLIFILKRIKKDHHRVKAMLKSSEKETALIKLENEKLELENKRLKTDIDDVTSEKAKVDSTNQQLKSTLSDMKKANASRAKEHEILTERLKKSESKLKVFIRPFL